MAKKIPKFSYTGESRTESNENYWYIYLLSSGELTFTRAKSAFDVFLVGGGAGGNGGDGSGGGAGGCGGKTLTKNGLTAAANQAYTITIGKGGAGGAAYGFASAGGATSAFGASAAGGTIGVDNKVYSAAWATGGSGGGTGSYSDQAAGAGGSDGEDGYKAWVQSTVHNSSGDYYAGSGQGTTTRAFGETSGALYAAGGGGGSRDGWVMGNVAGDDSGGNGGGSVYSGSGYPSTVGYNAPANRGGGGGGGSGGMAGGSGGSGIVILRGTQEDALPVFFDLTQLFDLVFNGTNVESLVYNGVKLFMRRWKRCLQ